MNSFAHDKRKDNEVRPTFPRRAIVTAGMPYGNKDLHFGHIGGVFVHADIYARFLRDRIGKENVLFVSGTDCYGSSIVEAFRIAVSEKGFTGDIEQFVRENHELQKKSLSAFDISLNLFAASALDGPAKTHKELCAQLMTRLYKEGHLTQRTGQQFFDTVTSLFLNGRQVEGICPIDGCQSDKGYADECSLGHQYEPQDLINPKSTLSGSVPTLKQVSNWYVDVPKFRTLLEGWLADVEASPQARPFAVKAIREFLEPPVIFVKKDDLESVIEILGSDYGFTERSSKSQSVALVFETLEERERACATLVAAGIRFRTGKTLVPFRLTGNQEWGLPSPVLEGEPARTWWVWPESLFAPISFSAYCCQSGKTSTPEWEKWWCDKNAGVFQFIGEDNVYFYGPAEMAMFLGLQGKQPVLPPPEGTMQLPVLVVNKHVQFLNKKISSSGPIKPPAATELLDHYTSDQLRAHFFGLGLGKQGVSFRPKAFDPDAKPLDADPVLVEGNLLSNVLNRCTRSCFYTIQKEFNGRMPANKVSEEALSASKQAVLTYERQMHAHQFQQAMVTVDKYIRDISKFWAKNSKSDESGGISPQALVDLFYYVRIAASMVHPIAPRGSELIREYFGVGEDIWSWERIFDPLDAFVPDISTHEFKVLPPHFDFFEKHASQISHYKAQSE
ncbi:MAG: class I tRNA ligase family protein [bacterium]|nr:class I tRNA ligase family protein [bacterium]